jgi:hypothetical protein
MTLDGQEMQVVLESNGPRSEVKGNAIQHASSVRGGLFGSALEGNNSKSFRHEKKPFRKVVVAKTSR